MKSKDKYSRDRAESASHEDAGFKGGCPFPQAVVRMAIRDALLAAIGITRDERDEDFLEDR